MAGVYRKCVPDHLTGLLSDGWEAGLTRDLYLGGPLKGFGIENNLDDPPATLVDQSRVA